MNKATPFSIESETDTHTGGSIAAISTARGRGGIAVIRISGSDAIAVADRIFRPKKGSSLEQTPGGRVRYGGIYEGERLLDTGVATVFRAPHSFTGEDTVELSCHGGILLSERVLAAALTAGALPAGPGEFTKRAFLNGKLGLSEAEAVIDLIDAESDEQMKIAVQGTEGRLSSAIRALYDRLAALLASAYVFGDYPDEDLADLSPAEMEQALSSLLEELRRLLHSYKTGHAVNEGIPCAIVGRPNAGKSSLLNALLGKERAIVSGEEGTTRDTVEESVYIGPVKLRLIDTAGLRECDSDAEKQGIRRSVEAIHRAELLLGVFDGSRPLDERDRQVLSLLKESGKPVLYLQNKADCFENGSPVSPLEEQDLTWQPHRVLSLCAKNGKGLDALQESIRMLYLDESILEDDRSAIVSNARQYAALCKAEKGLLQALTALQSGMTPDLAGLDVEQAMAALLEVDGRAALDDVVDQIFHRFCVGK